MERTTTGSIRFAKINFLITANGHLMSNLSGIFVSVKDRRSIITIVLSLCLLGASLLVHAQDPTARFRNIGGGGGGGGKGDSLQHRKADTITINFRYLDSSRYQKLDSSLVFYKKVPQPPTYINLGNIGTPGRDLVFAPRMISGWDAGWHSLDNYVYRPEDTRFYNTTKPYSEIGYLLGSKTEQLIDLQHTQNILPNWNIALEYRLISSPGSFQNENSNHNNYRGSSWYQSPNKRYQNFIIIVGSKLQVSENGGLVDFRDLSSDTVLGGGSIPVRLGNNLQSNTGNPFATGINTGTRYTNATYLMRQQYDLGQKDSIVTDTTVIPLFYPRLRLEHTLAYTTYHYRYIDQANFSSLGNTPYVIDSAYYANYYNLKYVTSTDTFFRETHWHDLTNDFSIYQFPDSKNPQQFIKLGASLQLLRGIYDTANSSVINVTKRLSESNEFVHAEYRNKTRNRKWDIEAYGKLYLTGLDAGDYNASVSLQRLISPRIGYLRVGFQNVNRTPSSVFDAASPFFYDTLKTTHFSKENTTHLFASLDIPRLHLKLNGDYYLMSNYAYFTNYFKQRQQSALFNLLQVTALKDIALSKHWIWHAMVVLQQVAGSAPVHVPLIISYNKIGYEGKLGFPNLNIQFGLEVRFVSGYQPDGYAPLSGQFFTQSDTTIKQHLPDITPYLSLRIRAFTAYIRTENVNALDPATFSFNKNNFVAPNYPSAALLIRFGFFWSFIN